MIIMTLQVTKLLVKVIIFAVVDLIEEKVVNLVDFLDTVWRPWLEDDDEAELVVDTIETRRNFV